ncbi:hypothetical protein GCK72_022520 [Caenorhabditis remanei]|uniref:ATP-dependent DNA helicase n=1 Tax=Caenorhabditis remanei TaxID=31234 RepID=A0A6A5FTY2_CAERE|nr:hypothetical protein GCK72_022520 [Caenorhabditis remanei]KAF1746068.1 hypothetical protein GCK72_022520 [Caenorhabditis remanei]
MLFSSPQQINHLNSVRLSRPTSVQLSRNQTLIRDCVKARFPTIAENPFHIMLDAAPGGCGKSTMLKILRQDVNAFFGTENACLVTAFTGGAAFNVGGNTIHSTLGISPKAGEEFKRMSDSMKTHLTNQLRDVKVLFIEEISLVSVVLLTQASVHLQILRNDGRPFGGLSVMVFGDFMQLLPVQHPPVFGDFPPIMKARCEMLVENVWDKLWKLFTVFHLTRNKRVEMGRAADMLREIRYTEISEETKEFLRKNCLLKNTFPKTIFEALDQLQSENPDKEFVVLATKNATVNRLNICRIQNMEERKKFPVRYIKDDEVVLAKFHETTKRPHSMELAVGCKVMLNVTLKKEPGMYNGRVGKLLEIQDQFLKIQFDSQTIVDVPKLFFKNNEKSWTQYPIQPAEVITVHMSQGKTFDGVIFISENLFTGGLAYTALSRCRQLRLCRLTSLRTEEWLVPDGANEEYRRLKRRYLDMMITD